MDSKDLKSVKINFNLRPASQDAKDAALNCVIRWNQQRIVISSVERVKPSDWNLKTQRGKKFVGHTEFNTRLDNIENDIKEVYRTLKPNKRCISVVMDIRKKDKFFPLHEDQSRVMREIGFELEEYVIWDRQPDYNNMKTLGYPWVFRFNKVHEYICIYWKR